MKNLFIDLETYSSVSLKDSGVYRYAEAEDAEVLLFGYSADGAPIEVVEVAKGEEVPTLPNGRIMLPSSVYFSRYGCGDIITNISTLMAIRVTRYQVISIPVHGNARWFGRHTADCR